MQFDLFMDIVQIRFIHLKNRHRIQILHKWTIKHLQLINFHGLHFFFSNANRLHTHCYVALVPEKRTLLM